MVTVTCPWCEMPAMLEMMADEDAFRCDECRIGERVDEDESVPVPAAA